MGAPEAWGSSARSRGRGVIAFLWSFISAMGFAMSGFLLRDGEFRLSGIVFVVTWLWFLFPKIPKWMLQLAGRRYNGHRQAAA